MPSYVSASLPPKVQGGSIGSIKIILKKFHTYYLKRTACRISFWGQDQFYDIYSGDFDTTDFTFSIEYPLVGTLEGIGRYFSDMNILPLPILQTVDSAESSMDFVGQGNILLPEVLQHLNERLQPSACDTLSMYTANHDALVPLISIPRSKSLNDPHQSQQIGEINVQFVLNVHGRESKHLTQCPLFPQSVDTHAIESKDRRQTKSQTKDSCVGDIALEDKIQSPIITLSQNIGHKDEECECFIGHPLPSAKSNLEDLEEQLGLCTSISSEFGLDNDSFSSATEDDSILMEALIEKKDFESSSEFLSPTKSKGRSHLGTSTMLSLLRENGSDDPEVLMYPSFPIRSMEVLNKIAKIRCVKLNIKSLCLSMRLLQPVTELMSDDGSFTVKCSLKFQAPPLVLLSMSQPQNNCIHVFEKIVTKKKSLLPHYMRKKLNQKEVEGTKAQTDLYSMYGSHEISHCTSWSLPYLDNSDVKKWMNTSLTFDMVVDIERLDDNDRRTNNRRKKRFPKFHKQVLKLASAEIKLETLLSVPSLVLDTKAHFFSTRKVKKGGFLVLTMSLLPAVGTKSNVSRIDASDRSIYVNPNHSSADSLDLINDTIISTASNAKEAMSFSISEASIPHSGSRLCPKSPLSPKIKESDVSTAESVTVAPFKDSAKLIWMYLSLAISTQGFPSKFALVRVRTMNQFKPARNSIESIWTKRSFTNCSEEVLEIRKENVIYKDFRRLTQLNIEANFEKDIAVTVEIWTHSNRSKDSNEGLNEDATEAADDELLGTLTIWVEIPQQLAESSIYPAVVRNSVLQIKMPKTKKQSSAPITLAVGFVSQINKFASMTEKATLIQRWLRTCSHQKDIRHQETSKVPAQENGLQNLRFISALLIQNFWRGKTNVARSRPVNTIINPTFSQFKMHNTRSTHDNFQTASFDQKYQEQMVQQSKKDRGLSYLAHEIKIYFRECYGIRELITLWADNLPSKDPKIPCSFQAQDWASSGIMITFSILSRSRHNGSNISPDLQILHYSSSISRMNLNRHLVPLNYEFSALIDESPSMKSYLQSERLLCELWYIPVATNAMLEEFSKPTANKLPLVPQEANLICTTCCPLTVLLRKGDFISYVCPWSLAHDLSFDQKVGKVQIDIGAINTSNTLGHHRVSLLPNDDCWCGTNGSDGFDWTLPDEIEAIMSQRFLDSSRTGITSSTGGKDAFKQIAFTKVVLEEKDHRTSSQEATLEATKKEHPSASKTCSITHGLIKTKPSEKNTEPIEYSENDSWTGRELDSVLASLDVVTNALISKENSVRYAIDKAQGEIQIGIKQDCSSRNVSASKNTGDESPHSFQHRYSTCEINSMDQPKTPKMVFDPVPKESEKKYNEESFHKEVESYSRLKSSSNAWIENNNIIPKVPSEACSRCCDPKEENKDLQTELDGSSIKPREIKQMEAKVEAKEKANSFQSFIAQEKAASRTEAKAKASISYSSSSSCTSSDSDFIPSKLTAFEFNRNILGTRTKISSEEATFSDSSSTSTLIPDVRRERRKESRSLGTKMISFPHVNFDDAYFSDSSFSSQL